MYNYFIYINIVDIKFSLKTYKKSNKYINLKIQDQIKKSS